MSCGVVIPTRRGGTLLERVVSAVLGQTYAGAIDLVLVDSGSEAGELDRLRALGARIESIPPREFDHGRTRDLGASLTSGEIVVFLNQDALPVDSFWLERLTAPFRLPSPPAAAQGGILEFPFAQLDAFGLRRFYWDSCGPRFYFTRESKGWIARHGGIGLSTVNCAVARWAWRELPFGKAAILEDKLWQGKASERGWRIEAVDAAAVWHTHDYRRLPALVRRCASEGLGWKLVGERYTIGSALGDAFHGETWRDWSRGLRGGVLSSASEWLFPILRPLALWWGNSRARPSR